MVTEVTRQKEADRKMQTLAFQARHLLVSTVQHLLPPLLRIGSDDMTLITDSSDHIH
jgi:hypothetical protein